MGLFGKAQLRVEDERLLRGNGRYVDDVKLPGMLHLALLRSPIAHGRIHSLSLDRARTMKGVVAVVGAKDLPHAARMQPDWHPNPLLKYVRGVQTLASAKVRYVGEPIAAVIAQSRYLAEDALELIDLELEPLRTSPDLQGAANPDAPRVHDDMPSNVAAVFPVKSGDADAAFAQAALVVEGKFDVHRGTGQAIETRGIVAHWEAMRERMAVWSTTQVPHVARDVIAKALSLPIYQVEVISPDVGGGFGYKGFGYAEDVLVPVLAKLLQRPVKWIEDRAEHLVAAYQERSQLYDAKLALDRDGTIVGLRSTFLHDAGAYSPWGPVVPLLSAVNAPGPYKVPNCDIEGRMIYTHRVPVVPVRGAGRPQPIYVIERLLDQAAMKLGKDPVALRLGNLIGKDDYPYAVGFRSRDGTQRTYDQSDVPAMLERACELISYSSRRVEQTKARHNGRYIGVGVACAVEEAGLGPYEEARVSVQPDGRVLVHIGCPSQGQGQATTIAQIVADAFDMELDRVEVRSGSTDYIEHAIGTYASRVAVVAGCAAFNAAKVVRERALRIAAVQLQCSVDALTMCAGKAVLNDGGGEIDLQSIARLSRGESGAPIPDGIEIGLAASASFGPSAVTYPTGAHACVVEVDVSTGEVEVLAYAAVQDFGTVINPLIVEGQVHGAFAHGIGNTFLERVVHDENGQVLTGTLMDYLMPTTTSVPHVQIELMPHATPLNPLGMKGAGQGGLIPVGAAISGAVEDALRPFGAHPNTLPFSPSDVLRWVRSGRAETGASDETGAV